MTDRGTAPGECHSCPGAGGVRGMYTANTMASVIEAMGFAFRVPPPTRRWTGGTGFRGRSGEIASTPSRRCSCFFGEGSGRATSRHGAFENGIAAMMALGGSTNGVLHILALAHEAKVPLELDDFHEIGRKVPMLGKLQAVRRYVMADLDRIGGIPM